MNPHRPTAAPIVAVDSDGSVLDAMTPKHEHAFTPALIEVWDLAAAQAEATERFLALNLRSAHRGVNRYAALGLFLRAWRDQPGAPAGWPPLDRLLDWISSDGPHSDTTLAAEMARQPGDAGLARALAWSGAVNARCAALPPPTAFPGAAAALHDAARAARLYVVSGGNGRAIRREWEHAGLAALPQDFLTQEAGSKTAILRRLANAAGAAARVLMVGDSPLDEEAAAAAGTAFFPIVPGREAESWTLFRTEMLPGFIGTGRLPRSAADWSAVFHASLAGPSRPEPATPTFPS